MARTKRGRRLAKEPPVRISAALTDQLQPRVAVAVSRLLADLSEAAQRLLGSRDLPAKIIEWLCRKGCNRNELISLLAAGIGVYRYPFSKLQRKQGQRGSRIYEVFDAFYWGASAEKLKRLPKYVRTAYAEPRGMSPDDVKEIPGSVPRADVRGPVTGSHKPYGVFERTFVRLVRMKAGRRIQSRKRIRKLLECLYELAVPNAKREAAGVVGISFKKEAFNRRLKLAVTILPIEFAPLATEVLRSYSPD